MSSPRPGTTTDAPTRNDRRLARRLTIRYVVALTGVALFLAASQILIQLSLTRQAADARVVNIAGRQRMLSQRLCVSLLALERPDLDHARWAKELAGITGEWATAQRGLREGASELGLPGDNSATVDGLFDRIQPRFQAMLGAAQAALAHPGAPGAARAALAEQDAFLATMNDIVVQYEREAHARVVTLRRTELVLLTLALGVLLFEGLFVFRPAVRGLGDYLARREHAERALGTSETEKRAVIEGLPDRVLRFARDGSSTDVRTGEHGALEAVVPTQDAASFRSAIERVLRGEGPARASYSMRNAGRSSTHEARIVWFSPDEVLAIIRDTTEADKLERQLLQVSDREQQRLGQDLHDGLGQHLLGIAAVVKTMRQKLAGGPLQTDIDLVGRLLAEASDQVRSMARSLHAFEVEADGLAAALRELAASTERVFGVPTAVRSSAGSLPSAMTPHLYRIAREAVTNAAKHAKASRIDVVLERHGPELCLTIVDDGVGVPEPVPTTGMGISLMLYRAKLLGASLEIHRASPKGTEVRCVIRQVEAG